MKNYESKTSDKSGETYTVCKKEQLNRETKRTLRSTYKVVSLATMLLVSTVLFSNTYMDSYAGMEDATVVEVEETVGVEETLAAIETVIPETITETIAQVEETEAVIESLEVEVITGPALALLEESAEAVEVAVETVINERNILADYSFALYDTGGRRNSIDANVLYALEDECAKWGVNPNLILGIVMTESEGWAHAKNKNSTATGLGQFLKGTGKEVYKNLLHMGNDYNHSMAKDPILNIRMTTAYMGDLINRRGSVHKAIQTYRGKTDVSGYEAKINRYMGRVGQNIYS